MNNPYFIDILIINGFFLVILTLGLIHAKKINNTEDYYIASRKMKSFPIAATVFASIIGGSALIGRSGIIYNKGLSGALLALPYLLGMFLFSLMSGRIQQIGQKNGFMSLPDLMEFRFGKKVRYLIAAMITFSMTATVASQVSAFATIISILAGQNMGHTTSIWIGLVIIVIYTAVCGFYGVVYTDILQFIMLLLFVYIALPIRTVSLSGGFSPFINAIPSDLLAINLNPQLFGFLITNLIFTFAGAEMWQRAFASKSPKTAKRGFLLGNTMYLYSILITIILSLSAAVLLPGLVNTYGSEEIVIPMLVLHILPAGMIGLTLAAVFSALMSSADTYLLVAVQSVVMDIIKPKKENQPLDDSRLLWLSRLFTVILGLGAGGIALHMKGIYHILMFAWTFYAASVGIPALAALFWKKATAFGVTSGIISGFIASVTFYLWGPDTLSPSLFGSVICLMFTIGGSALTYHIHPAPMPKR